MRYFEDYGVSSIGIRPHTVYGPGRDQGLTSAPTTALIAAAAGVRYHIPFGGSVQMQYTADAGEAFVRALHEELKNGADFADMARRYSRGPGAAEGGDLGFFKRGELVKPLEDVAFRLHGGAVSDPIRSPAGFHVLKVEEREARSSSLSRR